MPACLNSWVGWRRLWIARLFTPGSARSSRDLKNLQRGQEDSREFRLSWLFRFGIQAVTSESLMELPSYPWSLSQRRTLHQDWMREVPLREKGRNAGPWTLGLSSLFWMDFPLNVASLQSLLRLILQLRGLDDKPKAWATAQSMKSLVFFFLQAQNVQITVIREDQARMIQCEVPFERDFNFFPSASRMSSQLSLLSLC